VNLRSWEFFGNTQAFECVRRGFGVVEGYCPQLGYDRHRPTARVWLGHPDYVGEHWTGTTPVVPQEWTPNRIVFRVEPGQTVSVNQNPGSWWLVNGSPAFPGARCAEPTRPFTARADDRGRLVLSIRPRGLLLAAVLTVSGVLLALAALARTYFAFTLK
jgi:hypothetical protein